MWIFCALIGLFQIIILLMLSGILFSVAAISRLMEITIILIYPTAIFLLRQSANLIILLTILVTRMTSSAFHKLCALVENDRQKVTLQQSEPSQNVVQLQLDMQTPFVPYMKSVLEEVSEGTISFSSKDEPPINPSADEMIIEPSQDQSQYNNLTEEIICTDSETYC